MLNVSNEKIRKYCHIVMTIIVFIIQIMILLIKYHTSENLLTEIMDSISTIAITCVAVFLGVKRVVHKGSTSKTGAKDFGVAIPMRFSPAYPQRTRTRKR